MMQGPAVELGVQLSVLVAAPDEAAALVVPSAPVGSHTDVEAVCAFARRCDVVTFDHEHVPPDVLAALEALGIPLHPTPTALRFAQDKLAMRTRLAELGVPAPRWTAARTVSDVEGFAATVGWPVVAKTPRGGYDGKGIRVVERAADLDDWLAGVGRTGPLKDGVLLEERVPFSRELAVLVARSPSGQAAAWPVVETVQADGICTEVLAPAPAIEPGLVVAAKAGALHPP
jgi:5-(carboxyamino)imidazole ribonucleotide synthase